MNFLEIKGEYYSETKIFRGVGQKLGEGTIPYGVLI